MSRFPADIAVATSLPAFAITCLTQLSILVACCTFPALVTASDDSSVVVQELSESTWEQLVPKGKEVDAIYGDTVLQNQFIRAVIAKPVSSRNANMTIRNVGGCLIDLTTREHESDQLGAFFPGRRAFTFSEMSVSSQAATSTGANADTSASTTSQVLVKSAGTDSQPAYSVQWSLGSNDRFLTATSTWTNTTTAEITLSPEDDLRTDGSKEDFTKSENGTHDLFWFHDLFWQQAYGIHAPGYQIQLRGNSRESILTYERPDKTPIVIKPGESFSLTRHLFVNSDLPGVRADFESSAGKSSTLQEAVLKVVTGERPVAGAQVRLICADQERGTVVTGAEGTAKVRIPVQSCLAHVTVAGQQFAAQMVTLADGQLTINLTEYTPGTAVLNVVDGDGQPIAAKIEFTGQDKTPTPNWGPETAEFFVRNLAYTAGGTVRVDLASGKYDVTVSHGPEYHAEFTTLKIEPGSTTELTIKLPRLVSTNGWISADFHSHSTPSGDNTASQLGRVLNLVAEHVEFAPCTEHNRVSSYDEHLQTWNLAGAFATVSGMELTGQPLPLNHQNMFPMIYRPRTQDGGGPTADLSPETQIERAAAWDNNSVKLIQQNHPDIGWLFYDRNGDQVSDEGYFRSFGLINVMEIHPIDKLLNPNRFDIRGGKPVENHTAFNWMQLLNQGFRIYGVVNTDAHYNFHGSGGLRIWIKSDTDEPAKIQSDEMRDAARNGNIVMSNGPFLEATFRETGNNSPPAISGQDLKAPSGKVSATIRVQCANWLDVDTVMLLVNGRPDEQRTFTREKHPELFSRDTVRFEKTLDIDLPKDAHLIVLTGHSTQVLGPVTGPDWGKQHPAALSNPVFVDVDGDGFQASKDTLGIPLPVKFAAER
ncbi:MAG: CehA/McbA family metallohydrolase [Planctomycetia bacterium]